MKIKLLTTLTMGALLLGACADEEPDETGTSDTDVVEDAEASETPEETEADLDESSDSEETDVEDVAEDEPEEEETPDAAEVGTLTVGDSYTIDDITLTITDVSFTDERNQFEEDEPENVIRIDYELNNDSDSDYAFGMDFDVYADGRKMEMYANTNDIGSVSAGRTVDGTTHYGVEGDDIEIEWSPLLSFTDEVAIWSVNPN